MEPEGSLPSLQELSTCTYPALMFHLLLYTVLPEFDHCLEIYTFSALQ
jgi:hypothetical protein